MTSEVKQALPQVLMPKAGIEGKAARIRVPHAGFDEALGLGEVTKQQQKSGGAKASPQEADALPSWQRLAAKLGTAIDRAQGIGRNLAVALPEPGPELGPELDPEPDLEKNPAERSADDFEPAAADMPEPVTVKQPANAAPAFISYSRTPAISAKPAEPENPEVPTAADDKAEIIVARDAPADTRSAPPRSSVEGIVAKDPDRSVAPAFPTAKSDPVAPVATAPEARPPSVVAPPESGAADDTRKEKEAKMETAADTAKPAPRVTVLAQQNIPAPMPSTAIVLVDSIAASDLLEPARTVLSLDAIHASAAPASAQSLKIQLHPAELGMVTATLRFAGQQLSIELQVENHEAHRRLTSDSDTIVSSLRDLGYDIERVTVMQPSIASSSANRSDAGASMPSPQGRAPDQSGSGAAGGGNGGAGGRQSANGGNAGQTGPHYLAASKENQGGGLYI